MSILSSEYFILFLIITIGILVGRIKINGVALDTSAVIFVALVFGHFGFQVPAIFQTIGLIFFIYSIGIQAGPGFFESFQKRGLQLVAIAATVVISGGILTFLLTYFLFVFPE